MTTYFGISGTPQQYMVAGEPANGYVLKAYRDGTATAISIATDYTGGTLVGSVTLNAEGYPAVSGNVIIPHVAENYKLALYPTQEAADSDTGAVFTVDNNQVSSVLSSGALTDVPSASTVNLNSGITDYFNITGTTTINAITLAEGVEVICKFAGVVTITNGAFLINIGAVNITTQAGDIARFRGEAGGVVRMTDYTRTVVTGSVVGYQVTDSTDIALSVAPTQANVGSTVSITIPTKGNILLIPDLTLAYSGSPDRLVLGIRIGSTNYWPTAAGGAYVSSAYPTSTTFRITGVGATTIAPGSGNDFGAFPVYIPIEGLSIPTGAQTVQIVAAKYGATGSSTIKGTTTTTRISISVFDHS